MKKAIKILVLAILTLSFLIFPFAVGATEDTPSIEEYMLLLNGDVNGDGRIDNLDAALVLKYNVGTLTEFENKRPTGAPLEGVRKDEVISDFIATDAYLTEESVTVIESYGVYGDCEVFWININGQQDIPTENRIDIGGYFITYHNYFRLHVYKDGEFCGLDTAFNNGLITSEDVFEIMKICGGIYPVEYFDTGYGGIIADLGVTIINRFGDVNCDRVVDNLDAQLILKYDAGIKE